MGSLDAKDGRSEQGQELLKELRELSLTPWRDEQSGLPNGLGPRLAEQEPLELARLLGRQQRLQNYLRQRLSQLDANIDLVSSELALKMKTRGLASFDVPGIGRIWSDGMLLARMNPAQLEGAYKWLRDQGLGAIIKPQVNSATLRAQLKRHLQRGGERPPRELFCVELKLRARLVPEDRLEAANARLAAAGSPHAGTGSPRAATQVERQEAAAAAG